MNLPVLTSRRMRLEVFSQRCGLHPDLVRRLVVLGVVEAEPGSGSATDGALWFAAAQVQRVERMQRLRSDLGLNYHALGLVLDLLERIEVLERTVQTSR